MSREPIRKLNPSDGGPAFPVNGHPAADNARYFACGLSIRDWFAGQALAGMHARDSYDEGLSNPQKRAALAYVDADAMLKQRVKSDD